MAIVGKLNCAAISDLFDEQAADSGALVGASESPKISHLVKPLLDLGLRIHLVTLSTEVKQLLSIDGRGITLTVCPARAVARERDFYAVERRYIRDALLRASVDVVHAHHTYEYALGALGAGLPTLVSVRDWAPAVARLRSDVFLRSWKGAFRLTSRMGMQLTTLLRGRNFTVNSPYLLQRVRRIARGPVAIVPNCMPNDVLTSADRHLHSVPTLVSVNRGFSPLKNVKTLLKAFPLVREAFPGSKLRLVGSGYEPDGQAHSWAKEHDLHHRVEFLGPLCNEEVLALFDTADLLVHPSREESFGIVLMEAMARGTPVVGGRTSGAVPWVLGYGKAGALADVTKPQALAETIQHVLRAPTRWRELSDAGRQRVRHHFSAPAVASMYAAEYELTLATQGNA